MTEIRVEKIGGKIMSVSCSGHTGYAVQGEDIVCAGISTLVQTALLGLMSVAGINVKYARDEQKGTLRFELPRGLDETMRHDADVILGTMLCGLSDFYTEYSDYMKLEVIECL